MSYETHYEKYKELTSTYKVSRGTYGLIPQEQLKTMTLLEAEKALAKAIEEYDVVVERCGSVYAGAKYKVLRNTPNLSSKNLAIICDSGNLCFGYRTEGSYIIVYTD